MLTRAIKIQMASSSSTLRPVSSRSARLHQPAKHAVRGLHKATGEVEMR
jgi:hypothetical protein